MEKFPIKKNNTSLCAAISNKGLLGYKIFEKGMNGPDFLGFMSELSQSLNIQHINQVNSPFNDISQRRSNCVIK